MARVEAPCLMVVAEAFEARRASRLRVGQKSGADALADGDRIDEQHVDMAVGHEQESRWAALRLGERQAIEGFAKALRRRRPRLGSSRISGSRILAKADPIGPLRDAGEDRDVPRPGSADHHGWPRRRGSSLSRSASPSRLKPKRQEQDREAGEHRAPGRQQQEVAPLRQHQAERRRRRLRAEAEEGQRRLDQDGGREQQARLHEDHARRGSAGRAGR